MNRKLDARLVYIVLNALMALASGAMFTALSVYYVMTVGLNPLQLVLVGTVLEATILLFEVPTGVVADTYSRRLSVTIGMFILGAAWLLEGSIPLFSAILAAEVVRGVGETFLSGALDAWLADEVGEANVGAVYVRSGQVERLVGLLAIGVGTLLATWRLNWPVLFGGGVYLLLGVFLVLWMPETGFTPAPRQARGPLADMAHTLRAGSRVVRGHSLLVALLVGSALWGAASEGFDRLWEAHLLTNFSFPSLGHFQPVVWFGILNFAASLVGLGVTRLLQSRLEAITQQSHRAARWLVVTKTLASLAVLVFALAGQFWLAVVALLVRGALMAVGGPIHRAWLVQTIPAPVRATVLSMNGLTNAFGQTAGGPGVGALGNTRGLPTALAAASVLFLLEVPVYLQALLSGRVTATDNVTPVEPEFQ